MHATSTTGTPTSRPPLKLTNPSLATRLPPRRSRGHHCGTIVAFEAPRAIHYESKLEANVISLLLARRDLVDLREQIEPFHYVDADGQPASTRFDLLASLADGRRVAIAVKPHEIAVRDGLEAELELMARQMPRSFATHVKLMTDRDAPAEVVANARLMLSVRRDPENGDAAVIEAIAADLEGSVTIAGLSAASALDERAFRAIVRCIDRGALEPLGGGRIGPGTRVVRAARGARGAAA